MNSHLESLQHVSRAIDNTIDFNQKFDITEYTNPNKRNANELRKRFGFTKTTSKNRKIKRKKR